MRASMTLLGLILVGCAAGRAHEPQGVAPVGSCEALEQVIEDAAVRDVAWLLEPARWSRKQVWSVADADARTYCQTSYGDRAGDRWQRTLLVDATRGATLLPLGAPGRWATLTDAALHVVEADGQEARVLGTLPAFQGDWLLGAEGNHLLVVHQFWTRAQCTELGLVCPDVDGAFFRIQRVDASDPSHPVVADDLFLAGAPRWSVGADPMIVSRAPAFLESLPYCPPSDDLVRLAGEPEEMRDALAQLLADDEAAIRARTLADWALPGWRRGAGGALEPLPIDCASFVRPREAVELGLTTSWPEAANALAPAATLVGEVDDVFGDAGRRSWFLSSPGWHGDFEPREPDEVVEDHSVLLRLEPDDVGRLAAAAVVIPGRIVQGTFRQFAERLDLVTRTVRRGPAADGDRRGYGTQEVSRFVRAPADLSAVSAGRPDLPAMLYAMAAGEDALVMTSPGLFPPEVWDTRRAEEPVHVAGLDTGERDVPLVTMVAPTDPDDLGWERLLVVSVQSLYEAVGERRMYATLVDLADPAAPRTVEEIELGALPGIDDLSTVAESVRLLRREQLVVVRVGSDQEAEQRVLRYDDDGFEDLGTVSHTDLLEGAGMPIAFGRALLDVATDGERLVTSSNAGLRVSPLDAVGDYAATLAY